MKKNVLRILAAVLALTMVFSLAACGNDDSGSSSASGSSSSETSSAADESSSQPEESSSAADESSSEASSASAAEGKFATVKAFLEDPATKAQLDASIEQMLGGDDSMEVSLGGTDDTLIYNFKFSDEAMATTDEEALKTALAAGLDEENFVSTFEGIAASLSEAVEAGGIKVKVVYAKADGTELASKEYSAK